MKIFLPLLALLALPAQAQIYKWTDADGHVHYSDQPQAGVNAKVLAVPHAQSDAAPSKDDWRERDRISQLNRARQAEAEAERRVATAQAASGAKPAPFNPSVNRSNNAMTEEEMCQRDSQQIDFAEQTRHLAINHGSGGQQNLTEAQRQEVISERKANHALACGSAARR